VLAQARAGWARWRRYASRDTVKDVEQERITKTVPETVSGGRKRRRLPASHDRASVRGLANGDAAPTDDAELCERAGFPVEVVPDSPYNLKSQPPTISGSPSAAR